jgi:hypothetical protein
MPDLKALEAVTARMERNEAIANTFLPSEDRHRRLGDQLQPLLLPLPAAA